MSITVNDCPFCGHADVEIDEVELGRFAVCCPECECIGPVGSDVMTSIRAWNERRPAPAKAGGKKARGGRNG